MLTTRRQLIIEFEDSTASCPIASDQSSTLGQRNVIVRNRQRYANSRFAWMTRPKAYNFLMKHFVGKRYPTNVLSFRADIQLPEGPTLLGDIAVCLPVEEEEAHAQSKPL